MDRLPGDTIMEAISSSHRRTRPVARAGALMRRASVTTALATLLVVVTAQVVAAAKPIHDTFTVDQTFSEELCGIPVTTHLQVKGNVLRFDDHLVDLSQGTITWTNAAGDWLEYLATGAVFVTEELSGEILTVTIRPSGVQDRIRSAEGFTPVFDRGLVIFRLVIDLNDLEDPVDDVLISFEVLFQAGPHPEFEGDFNLFCQVVTDVLG